MNIFWLLKKKTIYGKMEFSSMAEREQMTNTLHTTATDKRLIRTEEIVGRNDVAIAAINFLFEREFQRIDKP